MEKQYLNTRFNTDATAGGAQATPAAATPADGGTPPPAAAPQAAPAAPSAPSWYDSFAPELKEYVQTKGFKDPAMLTDSYRNLEKLMGAPKEKLLRMPDAPDAPEWAGIYEKLGKPANASGYDKIKAVEGGAPAEYVEQIKGMFHKANLTTAQAEALYGEWNASNTAAAQQQMEALKAKGAQNEQELKTSWGNAYEQNLNVAKTGAQEFGATPEAITAMENAIGTKATMEFFHKIGSKLGEGTFTAGEGKSQGFGRLSPDAAIAQVNAYKSDQSFMAKYMSGSAYETKIFNDVMKDAYPGEMSI